MPKKSSLRGKRERKQLAEQSEAEPAEPAFKVIDNRASSQISNIPVAVPPRKRLPSVRLPKVTKVQLSAKTEANATVFASVSLCLLLGLAWRFFIYPLGLTLLCSWTSFPFDSVIKSQISDNLAERKRLGIPLTLNTTPFVVIDITSTKVDRHKTGRNFVDKIQSIGAYNGLFPLTPRGYQSFSDYVHKISARDKKVKGLGILSNSRASMIRHSVKCKYLPPLKLMYGYKKDQTTQFFDTQSQNSSINLDEARPYFDDKSYVLGQKFYFWPAWNFLSTIFGIILSYKITSAFVRRRLINKLLIPIVFTKSSAS